MHVNLEELKKISAILEKVRTLYQAGFITLHEAEEGVGWVLGIKEEEGAVPYAIYKLGL